MPQNSFWRCDAGIQIDSFATGSDAGNSAEPENERERKLAEAEYRRKIGEKKTRYDVVKTIKKHAEHGDQICLMSIH